MVFHVEIRQEWVGGRGSGAKLASIKSAEVVGFNKKVPCLRAACVWTSVGLCFLKENSPGVQTNSVGWHVRMG
jgi:hypothetical protein